MKIEKNVAQHFFDSAKVIMVAINSDEIVNDINDTGCEILGYSRDEILGKNWFEDFVPKSHSEKMKKVFHETLKGTMTHVHYEHPVSTKKGEQRIFDWHNLLCGDKKGNVTGLFSSGSDITDRRLAEEKQRQTENRLQSTLDSMLEGCQIIDSDFRYVYINESAARQGRQTKDQLIGHSMTEIYPGIDKTEMFSQLRQVMTTRIHRYMENEFTYPDGSKGWFDLRMEPVPEGVLILSVDIGDRKKTEQDLRKTSQLLSGIMESAQDIIILKDKNGRIFYANAATLKILGRPMWDVVGKPASAFFSSHAKDEVIAVTDRQLVASKKAQVLEETLQTPNGEKVFLSTESPWLDSEGEVAGIIVMARDITQRKKDEEQTRQQAALIDLSPDGIIVKKQDNTITFWSKGAEKMYGWTTTEAVGKSSQAILMTKFPEPPEEMMKDLRKTGQWSGELVHTTKYGKRIVVMSWWLAKLNEERDIVEIMESNVDITKRKELEQELQTYNQRLEEVVAQRTAEYAKTNEELTLEVEERRRTQSQLQLRATILDNAGAAIFLLNKNGDFAYANQEASKTYGYSADELLNMNIRQLVLPEDAHLIDSRFKTVVEKGQLQLETVHLRKDKSQVPVRVRHTLIRTAHGEFIVSAIRVNSG